MKKCNFKKEYDLSKKTNFTNWHINSDEAKKLELNNAEDRYMVVTSADGKLHFEGKFRITTEGFNGSIPKGFHISFPNVYAQEISYYNDNDGNDKKIMTFKILSLTDSYYANYYFKLKEINKIHIEYGFGKSSKIPGVFSESFIRYYYNLIKSQIQEFDAIDLAENKIEIKATSSKQGTVTINPKSKFDFLFWLKIDFENDEFIVYKANYSIFQEYLEKNNSKKRATITLNKFLKEKHKVDLFIIEPNCEIKRSKSNGIS